MTDSSARSWLSGTACGLLLVAGALVMLPNGDLHQLGNVPVFLLGAGLMLVGFFSALGRIKIPLAVIAVTAVAVRLILLWQVPGGDIFRYVWEGKLLLGQINPYLHAPDAPELIPLRNAIWESVEHKTFSAIYPPLAEVVFALLAFVSSSTIFFKLAITAADLLTGGLLWRRFGGRGALLYLWNPLVIYSFAGGGHYDSFFLLALVGGWIAWEAGKTGRAILLIGAAVALKWMALPILAWAVWRILLTRGPRAGILAGLTGAAPMAISWLAISLWTGEWASRLYPPQFTEYARSTELIPRIVGWLWEESRYHNTWFLPPLAVAWTVVILRAHSFATAAEWALFFALILSPMVHAWYFVWLFPFAVATRNLGTILLSASGFVYFVVYHRLHAEPAVGWSFTPLEITLLWMPFVIGFLRTYLRSERPAPSP